MEEVLPNFRMGERAAIGIIIHKKDLYTADGRVTIQTRLLDSTRHAQQPTELYGIIKNELVDLFKKVQKDFEREPTLEKGSKR